VRHCPKACKTGIAPGLSVNGGALGYCSFGSIRRGVSPVVTTVLSRRSLALGERCHSHARGPTGRSPEAAVCMSRDEGGVGCPLSLLVAPCRVLSNSWTVSDSHRPVVEGGQARGRGRAVFGVNRVDSHRELGPSLRAHVGRGGVLLGREGPKRRSLVRAGLSSRRRESLSRWLKKAVRNKPVRDTTRQGNMKSTKCLRLANKIVKVSPWNTDENGQATSWG
jgi:hypothetical protein